MFHIDKWWGPTSSAARITTARSSAAVVAAAERLAESHGARHVVLSGGVFQNATLLASVLSGLRKRKLSPLIHRKVPANDGGISYGQAAIGAARLAGMGEPPVPVLQHQGG